MVRFCGEFTSEGEEIDSEGNMLFSLFLVACDKCDRHDVENKDDLISKAIDTADLYFFA